MRARSARLLMDLLMEAVALAAEDSVPILHTEGCAG